jgi:hypothetical protein
MKFLAFLCQVLDIPCGPFTDHGQMIRLILDLSATLRSMMLEQRHLHTLTRTSRWKSHALELLRVSYQDLRCSLSVLNRISAIARYPQTGLLGSLDSKNLQ